MAWTSAALLLLATAGPGCAPSPVCPSHLPSAFVDQEIQALTPAERDAELARLQDLLARSYPHLAEKQERFGVRIEAVIAEQRSSLHRAVNRYEYRAAIDRILLAFHDAHLRVQGYSRPFKNTYRPVSGAKMASEKLRPRPDPVLVDVGLTLRLVEGKVTITRVREGSSAQKAGLRLGDAILMAGDQAAIARLGAVLRWRSWSRLEAGLQLAASRVMVTRRWLPDSPMPSERLVLERGGRRFHVTLAGGAAPDPVEHAFGYEPSRCSVGVIRARTFSGPRPALARRLKAALDEARGAKGLVLDLRGNGGGDQGLARSLARRLLRKAVVAGEYRYLRTPELAKQIPVIPSLPADPADPRFTVWQTDRLEPARDALGLPLAVITDELCASSCEAVARALSAAPGSRTFGQATAGSSGLPVILELPHSGLRISLPSWQARTPGGRLLEGNGVEPHVPVPLTRAGLEAGRDEPLEAALGHLCNQLAAERPGRAESGTHPEDGRSP